MNPLPIPTADPLGIPGPIWLVQHLSCFTLFLHFTATNLAVGGTLLVLLARGRGKGAGDHLAAWFFRLLPALMAAAITTAIPPLLFLQTLYGPFFYSASVLSALPMFSVLFLLGAAYLIAYLLYFFWDKVKAHVGALGVAILILTSVVALIWTALNLLVLHPERWTALYGNPHLGTRLDMGVPTLWPRLLHSLMAFPAVAGAFIALVGQYWTRAGKPEGAWASRFGAHCFLGITVLQLGVGSWYLISHPKEIFLSVMGGDLGATGSFGASLGLVLVAMILYGLSLGRPQSLGLSWAGWVSVLLTVYSMTAVRLHFRNLELKPYLDGMWEVKPQWGFITLFVGLLVGGLGMVGWMLWKVFAKPKGV